MELAGLDINGEWPDLDGQTCAAFILEEYWCKNTLSDSANVICVRVDETWHRLYFDCGIVFWRRSTKEPVACEMPELKAEVRLMDLGTSRRFVGEVIASVSAREIKGGAEVVFRFASGRSIAFLNVADHTTYVFG